MKLPGRTGKPGTPKNPRITPEARAEHTLLQELALQLGQEALKQNGLDYQNTVQLTPNTSMARVLNPPGNELTLTVTVEVTVSPHSTAATRIHTK